jgi:hypothetical protein
MRPLGWRARSEFKGTETSSSFTLSPDGRRLAFIAPGLNGRNLIWIRALDALEAHPLPGFGKLAAIRGG